jgi:predicted DNA-binding protein YlxM (UPF0122 family)
MEKEQNVNDIDLQELATVARRAAVKVSGRYPAIIADELLSAAYEGAVHASKRSKPRTFSKEQTQAYIYNCAVGYAVNEARYLSQCHLAGNLPPDHPDNHAQALWEIVPNGTGVGPTPILRLHGRLTMQGFGVGQKESIQLCVWIIEGYTQKEIAEKLGITQSAVSQRIKRLVTNSSRYGTFLNQGNLKQAQFWKIFLHLPHLTTEATKTIYPVYPYGIQFRKH